MKGLMFLLLILSAANLFCATKSKFILTGQSYPPIQDDCDIKVVWGEQGKYEVIGIAEIGPDSLENRIEMAKKIACTNGGDAIMPKVFGSDQNESVSEDLKYTVQSFLILKTKTENDKNIKVSSESNKEIEKPATTEKPDYSNLPRVSFKILMGDINTIKNEKFRGTLYPKSFFKTPRKLRTQVGRGSKLLLVTTRSGKYKLLVIIPKEKTDDFKKIIKSKDKLDFVYSPVTIYRGGRSTYPVLNYIDQMSR